MSQTGESAGSAAPKRPWPETVKGWLRLNRHFVAAATALLVAGAGWNGIMSFLHWTMAKAAVPWPPGVQVDPEDQRLTNFPARLGPYVLVQDGELSRQPDGEPDGIIKYRDEDLETLGTKAHELNWYYSALFRDERASSGPDAASRHYVQFDMTYYTGLLDAVPHVPINCLGAAGAVVIAKESGPISISVPAAPVPWDGFEVYRTTYVLRDHRTAQYHFFSMNGEPTARWELVRGRLTLPWVKHCYFAKIQLGALQLEHNQLRPVTDLAKCDELCRDFLKHSLPQMLRFLPSAEDVKRLERHKGSK